jgi:hypothetical protein
MFGLMKKKENLVSLKQVNELMSKFNKREELEQKKDNKVLIMVLVAVGLLILGLVVAKLVSGKDEDFDDFDDFDDDFDDMDYDDDYDDFDDYDEEPFDEFEE